MEHEKSASKVKNEDSSVEVDDTWSMKSDKSVLQTCWVCDCPPQAFYAIGAAFTTIGTLLFAIFLSEVLPGYVNTSDFEKSTCSVSFARFAADVCCESSVNNVTDCVDNAIYPCASVIVSVTDGDDDVTLYDGFYSWYFRSDTSDELRVRTCEISKCDVPHPPLQATP